MTKRLNSFLQYAAEHTSAVECNIADVSEVIHSAAHYTEQWGVDLILRGSDSKHQNDSINMQNTSEQQHSKQESKAMHFMCSL